MLVFVWSGLQAGIVFECTVQMTVLFGTKYCKLLKSIFSLNAELSVCSGTL